MLRKLAKRTHPWQIDLAAAALLLVSAAAAYLLEIGPDHHRYRDRDLRAAQAAQYASRERELDQTLNRTRTATADVRRFLHEQDLALEPRSKLNDRLTAIYSLANACGLTAESIEPESEAAEALYTTVGLRLTGRGGYQDCVAFMQRLRAGMPHCTVVGFEVSGSPSTARPSVRFSFRLLWHAAPAAVAGAN